MGIYLAAYGWLEDIRPSSKRHSAQDDVPAALQPRNHKPLYEYADNGSSSMLLPSTRPPQLRIEKRYLSHASSSNPDVMAVNLSSERVRDCATDNALRLCLASS